MDPQELFEKLLKALQPAVKKGDIFAHLEWDEMTQTPPAALDDMALLKEEAANAAHLAFIRDEIGDILSQLDSIKDQLDSNRARIVERVKFCYGRAKALPGDFVPRKEKIVSMAKTAWGKARAAKEFGLFGEHLQRVIETLPERRLFIF